jgi:biotin transport system substrate-specific component
MKINTRTLVMMAIFVALMAISAYVKIPFSLVPITFQLFIAVASGIFLGPVYGPISMGVYMIAGLVGLPVFANGGGIQYVLSPTFGFIIGFVLASYVIGALWNDAWPRRILAIILSVLSCYVIGIPYLWMLGTKSLVDSTVIMLPFIAKDIVLGGVLFGFAQTMGKVAPELMWRNNKSLT